MSLFDRRGARADQTNSPHQRHQLTHSNPRVENASRRSGTCSERLPSAARAGVLRCERRKAACSAGTARLLIQHEDGGLHKPSGGVGGEEDALQLGHEHADEGTVPRIAPLGNRSRTRPAVDTLT